MLAIAWIQSRSRTVTFGLCEEHLRRRQNRKTLIGGMVIGGIAMMAAGIYMTANHPSSPSTNSTVMCVCMFVGSASLWVVAAFIASNLSSPSFLKEQHGRIWIKGACEALVNAQPPVPASQPAKAMK